MIARLGAAHSPAGDGQLGGPCDGLSKAVDLLAVGGGCDGARDSDRHRDGEGIRVRVRDGDGEGCHVVRSGVNVFRRRRRLRRSFGDQLWI